MIQGDADAMRVLTVTGLELRVQQAGWLLEWLGPAVRGVTAWTLRERTCRRPGASCAGCQFNASCGYGRTFEPEPPTALLRPGLERAVRPLVLAPAYPALSPSGSGAPCERCGQRQCQASAGDTLGLSAVFIGPAVDDAEEILDALREGVSVSGIGPTTGRVRMLLENGPDARGHLVELTAADLPAEPTAVPGTLPRVTVQTTAPLAIKVRGQITLQPTLRDLVVASHTVLGQLLGAYDQPLQVPAARLLDAADRAHLVRTDFCRFEQTLQAGKGHQRQPFLGVVGTATFEQVPLGLLPWLAWGGRLHVGDRRVLGAGGWRVLCD